MDEGFREVMYHKYCESCKYKDKKNYEDPCDECLSEPARLHTEKPLKFEEAK